MEKPNRVAQVYGYTVCLIALVISLVTISALLNAAFERATPLQAGFGFGATLTSFDAYVATLQRDRGVSSQPGVALPDTTSEVTLRRRYDALVADQRASSRYRTGKTFVTNGVLLLLALGLFGFHWRWVRRLNGVTPAAA